MSIAISLKAYEGPLDLLLDLIREKRVDIYDIPIAEITREYLNRLKLMEDADLEIASEFMVMAATLMEIKARLLLPKEKKPMVEDEPDPRLELVNRLLLYKQFKEAAFYLGESFETQSSVYSRESVNEILLQKLKPDEDLRNMQISLNDLCLAFQVVLEAKQSEEQAPLPREKITIEEQIRWLTLYVKEKGDILFQDLFGILKSKVLLVVTFLALLELVHRGVLGVRQNEKTSTIYIYYLSENEVQKNYDS